MVSDRWGAATSNILLPSALVVLGPVVLESLY